MPIYEYKCLDCAYEFSLLRSIYEIEDAECPKCGSRKTKKIISTFACSTGSGSTESSTPLSSGG